MMVIDAKLMMRIYILVHIVSCTYALNMIGRDSKCESNRATLCQGLYNETRVSNTPHRSQDDNILDLNQYQRLINTRCAANLRLFLCSFFIPMCTILDEDLRPCRSLCEEVKKGCEVILQRYVDLPWPQQLRCEQFNDYDGKTLCIGNPNPKENQILKTTEVAPDKRTRVDDNVKIVLRCDERTATLISFKKIVHETKNCIRSASQEAIRKLCNGEKICEFELKDVTNKSGQKDTCLPGNVGISAVKYTCVKEEQTDAKQLTLQYGQDESLYCENNKRHIVIKRVQFKDETCITPNAFCSVTQSCTGRRNCVLWANNHYIPSPCKGERLNLSLTYDCVKSSEEEKVVDGDLDHAGTDIKLECSGGMISIVRAEYIDELCRNKEIHCAVNFLCEKKSCCILNKSNLADVECKQGQSKARIRYVCT